MQYRLRYFIGDLHLLNIESLLLSHSDNSYFGREDWFPFVMSDACSLGVVLTSFMLIIGGVIMMAAYKAPDS